MRAFRALLTALPVWPGPRQSRADHVKPCAQIISFDSLVALLFKILLITFRKQLTRADSRCAGNICAVMTSRLHRSVKTGHLPSASKW